MAASNSIVKRLALREQAGKLQPRRRGLACKLLQKIPFQIFTLKSLVPRDLLEDGYVFLGFSKAGQFVVSYTMHMDTDEHTAFPVYVYRLQWWYYILHKPLQLVSQVRLFGDEDILQELFLVFCEWPADENKVVIYGYSVPGSGDDICNCFLTVTAVPSLGVCRDCLELKKEGSESRSCCLQHSFCVHTKYELALPFPPFLPRVQLKIDGIIILNTGDSIVALQVDNTPPGCSFSSGDDDGESESGRQRTFRQNLRRSNTLLGEELFTTRTSELVFDDVDSAEGGPGSIQGGGEGGMQEVAGELDLEEVGEENKTLGYMAVEAWAIPLCPDCAENAKACDRCRQLQQTPTPTPTPTPTQPFVTPNSPSLPPPLSTPPHRPALRMRNGCSDCNCNVDVRTSAFNSCDCLPPKCSCRSFSSPGGGLMRGGTASGNGTGTGTGTGMWDENVGVNSPSTKSHQSEGEDVVMGNPTPRAPPLSNRSFFSPSNSGTSTGSTGTSKSSESVVVHTNHARTITFSLRRFALGPEEDVQESPLLAEDEYDIAYRSILPITVVCSGDQALSIVKALDSDSPLVTVLQFTFDIEHYMAEAIRQEAEWGQRYVGPYNYDLQILDVCPETNKVYGIVYLLMQVNEKMERSPRIGKATSYQTSLTFEWNISSGVYSTLHIDDLTEATEQRGKEWKPGSSHCNALRRHAVVPQNYYSSVHHLTNEAVFKGKSLPMLIAAYHHTAIVLDESRFGNR